jgi:hypothetical protein
MKAAIVIESGVNVLQEVVDGDRGSCWIDGNLNPSGRRFQPDCDLGRLRRMQEILR